MKSTGFVASQEMRPRAVLVLGLALLLVTAASWLLNVSSVNRVAVGVAGIGLALYGGATPITTGRLRDLLQWSGIVLAILGFAIWLAGLKQ
jgi:hypothetical protein